MLCLVLGLVTDARAAADRLPSCAACHDTGAGGAPRIGRPLDWAPHLQKGMPVLVRSVRQGVAGTLMAGGICEDCSDAEIESLIRRMSNRDGSRQGNQK